MSSIRNAKKKITRREFVINSAAGSAAGLVAGVGTNMPAATPAQSPWLPKKWDHEADVVVVGSGYAGINAAIAAHDAGAKVLVLEKAPEKFAGGNSAVSGGGMRIPVKVPEAIDYYRALCFGTVPDELCATMVEALSGVPEQLKRLGIEVAPIRSYTKPATGAPRTGLSLLPGSEHAGLYAIVPPGEKQARMGTGHQLYLALKKCLDSRKIKVMYETAAEKLIQDPVTKAVLGVIAHAEGKGLAIKAKKAVVLACGGYEANYEMQGYFNYPGIKIYPWGTPYNTGDGVHMASEAGAALWHMFSIEWDAPCLRIPSEKYGVAVQVSAGAGSAGGFIFVNKYGKRFMNDVKSLVHTKESLELTYFSHERVEYPNMPFYIIFDETFRLKQPLASKRPMSWNGIHNLCEWSADNSAEIEKGWIIKAENLRELAAKLNMDAAGLAETVAKYNEYCKTGKDPEFGRPKQSLLPIETPPYYAAELALTLINTQGGPKHNGKAQALDRYNNPIPRLYTPGELGSFFGFLYPGGSNIPEAIAFGWIAGKNAASEKGWS